MNSIGLTGRIPTVKWIAMDEAGVMSCRMPVDSESGTPAFADAVTSYQSLVFSIAYHLLRNTSLAEETAQDVFLRLYRDYHKIASEPHLVHW